MITLEMRFPYPDRSRAEAVMAAVSPENRGFAEARLEGSEVVVNLSSENAATLRNSADDLLACVKAAEASIGIATGSEPRDEEE